MSIKVTFIGAMHCKGQGQKGPYDFCQIKYMAPLQNVSNEKRQVVAFGCEEATIDLDREALQQFRDVKPGEYIALEVGPNPQNLNRNICTGLAKA